MAVPMKPGDPAYWMLLDDVTSKPKVHRPGCYICEDPEFAQMGLPLCRPCPKCLGLETGIGHIAADDNRCDVCGYEDGPEDYEPAKSPDPGKPADIYPGDPPEAQSW